MNTTAQRDADAIRYIVLRKLASGLRHTLMGELQSIQFLAELGARRMDDSGADGSKTREFIGKISVAAGEAIGTCHSVIEWLRPEEGAVTTLGEAVGQCVKLAGDDWRMRATQATIEMPGTGGRGEGIEVRGARAHRHVGAGADRPASRIARHRGRRSARRRSRRSALARAPLEARAAAAFVDRLPRAGLGRCRAARRGARRHLHARRRIDASVRRAARPHDRRGRIRVGILRGLEARARLRRLS